MVVSHRVGLIKAQFERGTERTFPLPTRLVVLPVTFCTATFLGRTLSGLSTPPLVEERLVGLPVTFLGATFLGRTRKGRSTPPLVGNLLMNNHHLSFERYVDIRHSAHLPLPLYSGLIRPVKAGFTILGGGASEIFSAAGGTSEISSGTGASAIWPSKRRCFFRPTSGVGVGDYPTISVDPGRLSGHKSATQSWHVLLRKV